MRLNRLTIVLRVIAALVVGLGTLQAQDHWSFRPVRPPSVPPGAHPIDALVDLSLETSGYRAVGRADLPSLVRRMSYDLHGLPPTRRQQKLAADKGLDALADQRAKRGTPFLIGIVEIRTRHRGVATNSAL